jgi:predicted dehydrogenase
MKSLRAGVIGVGHLGQYHAQKYAALPDIDLIGVIDTDPQQASHVASTLNTRSYTDYHELLDQLDLVSIAVPTEHHFQVTRDFLNAGIHVLLEKPITNTPEEAQTLIDLAREKQLVFQIGHLERFNPALQAIWHDRSSPVFIESHRLAPFNIRGTDVDVVLDLMIHDIDIILSMVNCPLTDIRSVGTAVLTPAIDIANARLEFANGCVANLTASRVSNKHMRKIRLFEHNSYISIDFFAHKITYHKTCGDLSEQQGELPICIEEQSFEDADALMAEIQSFIRSIKEGIPPVVTGEDGKRALEIALEITRKNSVTAHIS